MTSTKAFESEAKEIPLTEQKKHLVLLFLMIKSSQHLIVNI